MKFAGWRFLPVLFACLHAVTDSSLETSDETDGYWLHFGGDVPCEDSSDSWLLDLTEVCNIQSEFGEWFFCMCSTFTKRALHVSSCLHQGHLKKEMLGLLIGRDTDTFLHHLSRDIDPVPWSEGYSNLHRGWQAKGNPHALSIAIGAITQLTYEIDLHERALARQDDAATPSTRPRPEPLKESDSFSFGENWLHFLRANGLEWGDIEKRMLQAKRSLLGYLDLQELRGLSFLDVGSGSGLMSLAALHAGAEKVVSVDRDVRPASLLRDAMVLKWPDFSWRWTIEEVDIAAPGALLRWRAQFDIVYSYGVLHHVLDNGWDSMWDAFRNVVTPLKADGILHIAVYHSEYKDTTHDEFVNEQYNKANDMKKKRMELAAAFQSIQRLCADARNPFQHVMAGSGFWEPLSREPSKLDSELESGWGAFRGMAFWTDVRDGLGGKCVHLHLRQIIDFARSNLSMEVVRHRWYGQHEILLTNPHGVNSCDSEVVQVHPAAAASRTSDYSRAACPDHTHKSVVQRLLSRRKCERLRDFQHVTTRGRTWWTAQLPAWVEPLIVECSQGRMCRRMQLFDQDGYFGTPHVSRIIEKSFQNPYLAAWGFIGIDAGELGMPTEVFFSWPAGLSVEAPPEGFYICTLPPDELDN